MSTNKSFSTETSERYSRALFEVVKAEMSWIKLKRYSKFYELILIQIQK